MRQQLNPTLKLADLHCGYGSIKLSAEAMRVDIRFVDRVSDHAWPVYVGASFRIEDRVPGLTPA